MLKKRIIPCLDIKEGRTVKGVNFMGLQDAGDPVDLAIQYVHQGADELVFLDITATQEKRAIFTDLVKRIAKNINIPFTVGGGIRNTKDVRTLLQAGADKVSINSSAVYRPELITELANTFGSQCIVVAIDTKYINGHWKVYVKGGYEETKLTVIDWAKQVESLGAGEILLTSMNKDGTKSGFSLDITNQVSKTVNIPVIASGGAGNKEDFKNVFIQTRATGALAASVFHYKELIITELKAYLKTENIAIR